MNKIVFYLIAFIVMISCNHSIYRSGYTLDKSNYKKCDIIIKKYMHISDSLQKIGEIKLGESGFSVVCSEAHALEILKKEGCSLNANIINITEEKRPDLWSSCYRCRAEFYRYSNPEYKLQSDEIYKDDLINNRVSQDRNKNTGIAIGAAVIGFVFGFLFL